MTELEPRQICMRAQILNLHTVCQRSCTHTSGDVRTSWELRHLPSTQPFQSKPEPGHGLGEQFLPGCPHTRFPKAALFCVDASIWSSFFASPLRPPPTLHKGSTALLSPGSIRNKPQYWCHGGVL